MLVCRHKFSPSSPLLAQPGPHPGSHPTPILQAPAAQRVALPMRPAAKRRNPLSTTQHPPPLPPLSSVHTAKPQHAPVSTADTSAMTGRAVMAGGSAVPYSQNFPQPVGGRLSSTASPLLLHQQPTRAYEGCPQPHQLDQAGAFTQQQQQQQGPSDLVHRQQQQVLDPLHALSLLL